MRLKRILVAKGKKKVKFFFWIRMSPGSLPIQGIFPERRSNPPIAEIKRPSNMRNLPMC
jgi:hypothetical protein